MNKWQRWSQPEDGRSPVTGTELVRGPATVGLAPYCEQRYPEETFSVYHAQMILCLGRIDGLPIHCGELLNSGESCEHLVFDGGPGAAVHVLQGGIYQIVWRSFSPWRAVVDNG